jgi:signal recognition particle receptor subunit alpha
MLESMTIFSQGGLILYQYTAQPSIVGADDPVSFSCDSLNEDVIAKFLVDPSNTKTYHIHSGLTYSWRKVHVGDNAAAKTSVGKVVDDFYVVALYPDIMFEGPRQYLKTWSEALLENTAREYGLYQAANRTNTAVASSTTTNTSSSKETGIRWIRPDPAPFDTTFRVLLAQSKGTSAAATAAPVPTIQSGTALDSAAAKHAKGNNKAGAKEKRNWHDGQQKVTDKNMAELDRSKAEGDDDDRNNNTAEEARMERALQDARQAYLPDAAELIQEKEIQQTKKKKDDDTTSSWSSSITGMFQQLIGNKVLQASDLDQPLRSMEELLTSKNVAREIAHDLCESCRSKLTGKRLNSLYRIQTAIEQAIETVLSRLLNRRVDLLRNVLAKRGSTSLLQSITSGSSSSSSRAPYVISVMGINGIGKTTTLAKLAYYFQQHGCTPLLVAGDTFRSGAVEQLKVHAKCLDVPLFSQGYSKDPSAVAKAAIQHAIENGNDVVLVDTAGRMQNNVPLMKALGKLVQENKPDFCILVCEALVGHDGLNQFQMFQKAMPAGRGIDGLILTKFDTVSDKVGAALTLTHETRTPVVFCGTGQKYHHLKELSVPDVIQSLLS